MNCGTSAGNGSRATSGFFDKLASSSQERQKAAGEGAVHYERLEEVKASKEKVLGNHAESSPIFCDDPTEPPTLSVAESLSGIMGKLDSFLESVWVLKSIAEVIDAKTIVNVSDADDDASDMVVAATADSEGFEKASLLCKAQDIIVKAHTVRRLFDDILKDLDFHLCGSCKLSASEKLDKLQSTMPDDLSSCASVIFARLDDIFAQVISLNILCETSSENIEKKFSDFDVDSLRRFRNLGNLSCLLADIDRCLRRDVQALLVLFPVDAETPLGRRPV